MLVTLNAKGQITISKVIRKASNLQKGDRIELVLDDEGKLLVLPINRPVKTRKGLLPKPQNPEA